MTDKSSKLRWWGKLQERRIGGLIEAMAAKFVSKYPLCGFEDLVQEGWQLFYMKRGRFSQNKGAKFTTWFYSTLKNYLTSYVKKEYAKWSVTGDMAPMEDIILAKNQWLPSNQCDIVNMLEVLEIVLSPYSYKLLRIYMSENRLLPIAKMARELKVSERDFSYMQRELRTTAQYFFTQ